MSRGSGFGFILGDIQARRNELNTFTEHAPCCAQLLSRPTDHDIDAHRNIINGLLMRMRDD